MKQQELRITEDESFDLPRVLLCKDTVEGTISAGAGVSDSASSPGTAIFVVAPCRSLDEGRSLSKDEGTEGQAVDPRLVEWLEDFQSRTGLKGPKIEWGDTLVAGDDQWTLWRRPWQESHGPWRNYKLFLKSTSAPKRIWRLGWHPNDYYARGRDVTLLEVHYPQIFKWVRQVALKGPLPVPKVEIQTRKQSRREKLKHEGTFEERRRKRQRERYQRMRAEMLEKQRSEELPAGVDAVVFVALQKLWEAKTPLSIRRQAPKARFAPAVLAESLGLSERQIEGWIKRQIAEGRIAEEMSDRKNRTRGLRVLDVLCKEEKTPSSEKPEV